MSTRLIDPNKPALFGEGEEKLKVFNEGDRVVLKGTVKSIGRQGYVVEVDGGGAAVGVLDWGMEHEEVKTNE